MKGGAWPFFVGDLTCQVDFDNERDYLSLILKLLACLFLNCTIVGMLRFVIVYSFSVKSGCESYLLQTVVFP